MKKCKFLVVVLIGLLMISGVIILGCKDSCPLDGTCFYNMNTDDYKWCHENSCAVYASTTATRCDC